MGLFKKGSITALVAGACLASAVAAAPASANFTPPFEQPCSGGSITAAGTSVGGLLWQEQIEEFTIGEGCPGFTGSIAYSATSSGQGLSALRSSRDPNIRLVGTAEAPGNAEIALIDAGKLNTKADNAQIRTIPEYVGAITTIVNFPDGCTVPAGSAIPSEAETVTRFQVSNAALESVFAGNSKVDTWGELLPGIEGAGCATKPIKRVVPSGRSGATFALKRWLATVNSATGWEAYANPLLNTAWPRPTVNLVRASGASASVAVNEATTVSATDGSIGFTGLDVARAQGFSQIGTKNDDRYWIPLHDSIGNLVEPSHARITSAVRGANCEEVPFSGVPSGVDPTLESWQNVSVVQGPGVYPLCALIYGMAWDDSADAYGNTEAEQAQQRTVSDFVNFQLSGIGQSRAVSSDQSPLSEAILPLARAGAQQIGWAK